MKQQKVAVLSDIHGNYLAFQACLKQALELGIHTFFFLGDYLGEFPNPEKTLELIYEMKEKYECFFIRGNKEDYWINRRKGTNCDWKDGNHSVGAMKYCFSRLKETDIDWFETLPVSQTVQLEDCEPILLCHGSPFSNREKMLPKNENTEKIVLRCEEKWILCGHTHLQGCMEYPMGSMDRRTKSGSLEGVEEREAVAEKTTIINPGAVGVPLHFPGAACMAVMTYEEDGWKAELLHVPYDIEAEIAEIHQTGLFDLTAHWCMITEHLLRTGEVPHVAVLSEVMRLDANRHPWHSIPDEYWDEVVEEMLKEKS